MPKIKNTGKCAAGTKCRWMQWAQGKNTLISTLSTGAGVGELVVMFPKKWDSHELSDSTMVRLVACPACGGDPNEGAPHLA